MKRQAYTMIAMIVLVGSLAAAAQGQISGRTQLIANIPFEFKVGSKTLPAGKYTVAKINRASDRVILLFRSKDGSASAIVQMTSVSGGSEERARLIFHRYGNQYFFSQAWVGGDSFGLQAPKPHAERNAERELARLKMAPRTIRLTK